MTKWRKDNTARFQQLQQLATAMSPRITFTRVALTSLVRSLGIGLVLVVALTANALASLNSAGNVYGPDRSGTYGGAQGIGGLDGFVVEASGAGYGSLNDYFVDAIAVAGSGYAESWSATLGLGGYGELPGNTVNSSLQPQWRGHYEDWDGLVLSSGSTVVSEFPGFYYLGSRGLRYESCSWSSASRAIHSRRLRTLSCHPSPAGGGWRHLRR